MPNYHQPVKHKVSFGETHATVTDPSGRIRTVKILEKKYEGERLVSVLLNALVHQTYNEFEDWKPQGCYVTEFIRNP